MTIEERAAAFPRIGAPADVLSRHGYIAGATEQLEIDIWRAVEILKNTNYFVDEEFSEEVMIDQFVKSMKGE